MISAFDIWRIATAINMHFNSGYDAYRYNFKAKQLTPFQFDRRKDKYHFIRAEDKFADKQHVIDYVFSNKVYEDNNWIGEMTDGPLQKYRRNIQSIKYKFNQDLNSFDMPFDDILFQDRDTLPPIIQRYLAEGVLLETVVILDILTNFITNIPLEEDMFWPIVKTELLNARPFINAKIKDKTQFKNIVIKRENSLQLA